MILYIEPQESTKKLLELIHKLHKVTGYKFNKQKSVAFLYTNNEEAENEIKKLIAFTIALNAIRYLEINLTKERKYLHSENRKQG